MPSSYATSKQIASATRVPSMRSGSRRVPWAMSRGISRSWPKLLLKTVSRQGMYSPNGTGWRLV